MMRHLRCIVEFALVVVFIGGCSNNDTSSTNKSLRWRFKVGEKFHVRVVRNTDTIFSGEFGQRSEKSEFVTDELCVVESVDKHGTAKFTMVIERIRMKSQSQKGNLNLDTAKSTNHLPAEVAVQEEMLKQIIRDLKVSFSLDCRGQILTAEVDEKAVKTWSSIIPGGAAQISDRGITKTLKQMLPVLPESPLAVGDTWTDTLELNKSPNEGLEKVLVTYRYAGPIQYQNKTVEKIVAEAKLDCGKKDLPQGLTANVVSQENTGAVYFDNSAGHLVKIENTQKKLVEYRHDHRSIEEQTNITSTIEIRLTGKEP